jgi:hypothetical protein
LKPERDDVGALVIEFCMSQRRRLMGKFTTGWNDRPQRHSNPGQRTIMDFEVIGSDFFTALPIYFHTKKVHIQEKKSPLRRIQTLFVKHIMEELWANLRHSPAPTVTGTELSRRQSCNIL